VCSSVYKGMYYMQGTILLGVGGKGVKGEFGFSSGRCFKNPRFFFIMSVVCVCLSGVHQQ